MTSPIDENLQYVFGEILEAGYCWCGRSELAGWFDRKNVTSAVRQALLGQWADYYMALRQRNWAPALHVVKVGDGALLFVGLPTPDIIRA